MKNDRASGISKRELNFEYNPKIKYLLIAMLNEKAAEGFVQKESAKIMASFPADMAVKIWIDNCIAIHFAPEVLPVL